MTDIRRIRMATAAAALVFIAVVVVAGSGSINSTEQPAAPTRTDPANRPLALSGYSNMYVVHVESRRVDALTNNRDEEIAQGSSWAPAARIAFTQASCDECFTRLFLARSDGSKKRVPTRLRHVFQPSWAPDGQRIVLSKLGSGIYTVNGRSGSTRRLSARETDEAPAWSPDGRRILFHRQVSATNWDLYVMDGRGDHVRRLTRSPLQQTNPSWSPDGEKVAFAEQGENGNWAIYTMRLDGSDRKRVTDEQISSQEPAWSPDGDRIAFILQREARAAVAVVDAHGRHLRRLTGSSLVASRPAWSPDGRKIVFSAKYASRSAGHGH